MEYEEKLNILRRKYSNHDLSEVAYWAIFDEGPVDFGASMGSRFLGLMHGSLENVLRHAVVYPGFWGWGPGQIKKTTCKHV